MRTFPVPILRRIKGFTLVELLIVILIISIFITFASVNWNVATKKGKEALLEDFSIKVALIREDAISHYENRMLEFDVSNGEVRVGRLDIKTGFVETGLLHLPEDYLIKDVVINGDALSAGEMLYDFLRERDGGQDSRPLLKEARILFTAHKPFDGKGHRQRWLHRGNIGRERRNNAS